jgi:hypothetical protein
MILQEIENAWAYNENILPANLTDCHVLLFQIRPWIAQSLFRAWFPHSQSASNLVAIDYDRSRESNVDLVLFSTQKF